MLQFLIGPVVGLIKEIGGNWLKNRRIKQEGKIRINQAKIEAKVKRVEQQGEMDIKAVEGMRFSWKDELLTVWTITIVTACFIPQLQPYIREGFIFLKTDTPEWFGWCFVGMYAAVFGLRTWVGWKKNKGE